MSDLTASLGGLECDLVEQCAETICASAEFRRSERLKRFLRFVVSEKLAGQDARLKAYTIALAVFDRPSSFDPQIDPVVRIEAGRLRRALERYYHSTGKDDRIVITVPRGGYAPVFELRAGECFSKHNDPERAYSDANVRADPTVSLDQCAVDNSIAPRALGPGQNSFRGQLAFAALVSVLLTATLVTWIVSAAARPAAKPLVAVTPFVSAHGDERAKQIAEGASEELIDHLAKFSRLRILGRQAARQAVEDDQTPLRSRYRVRYAIEGSVSTWSERGILTARLIDVPTGEVVWTERYLISDLNVASSVHSGLATKVAEAISQSSGLTPGALAKPAREYSAMDTKTGSFVLEAHVITETKALTRAGGKE